MGTLGMLGTQPVFVCTSPFNMNEGDVLLCSCCIACPLLTKCDLGGGLFGVGNSCGWLVKQVHYLCFGVEEL